MKRLNGLPPMDALINELDKNGLSYSIARNSEQKVTHLFFAFPDSVKLARRYNTVVIFDSTYKTNKFKMPLFQMVGVTSLSTTFHVAFAFIEDETQSSFDWCLAHLKQLYDAGMCPSVIVTDRDLALLNSVDKVFPEAQHMLCTWHIEKQVLANTKKHFESNERYEDFAKLWAQLVASKDQQTFFEKYILLKC